MNIFIVEDSPGVRERVKSVINELEGFGVSGEADNEKDAVSSILRIKPNIVILDLTLAGGSGIEVLRKIKEALPGTRVIILSNHTARPYREKCRMLGADYFLSKDKEFDLLKSLLIYPMFNM